MSNLKFLIYFDGFLSNTVIWDIFKNDLHIHLNNFLGILVPVGKRSE